LPARTTTRAPIATRLGQFGRGPSHFWQPLPKCCRPSVELTAYKSYSIPADVLGAFAVSHANVWRCGLKVTPVPARFRLHPILACRLPYRFPRGRFTRLLRVRVPAPWLPYRFPRGRLRAAQRPGIRSTSGSGKKWFVARNPSRRPASARLRSVDDGGGMEGQVPTVCGVWRARWRRQASIHAAINALAKVACGVSITAQARSSIEMRTSRSSCLTQHWPSANTWLGQAHAFPRHVRNSR
jgi:hypothetical protein